MPASYVPLSISDQLPPIVATPVMLTPFALAALVFATLTFTALFAGPAFARLLPLMFPSLVA